MCEFVNENLCSLETYFNSSNASAPVHVTNSILNNKTLKQHSRTTLSNNTLKQHSEQHSPTTLSNNTFQQHSPTTLSNNTLQQHSQKQHLEITTTLRSHDTFRAIRVELGFDV